MEPQNIELRDQAAVLMQKDSQTKSVTTLEAGAEAFSRVFHGFSIIFDGFSMVFHQVRLRFEALKSLKQDLNDSLEAKDLKGLQMLLQELDALPLTWDAASETKIGKEALKRITLTYFNTLSNHS